VAIDVKKGSCRMGKLAEIFVIKGVSVLKICDFLPTRIPGIQLLTLVNMYEKQVVNALNHISKRFPGICGVREIFIFVEFLN
jgi:hypothetical protein